MEYVSIKPILKENYTENIIQNIYTFTIYNTNSKESFIDIKFDNNIIISLKYNDINFKLILQIPFDYPNNFDFITLTCFENLENREELDKYITNINQFIRNNNVNINIGFILKYMYENINTITGDIKIIETPMNNSIESKQNNEEKIETLLIEEKTPEKKISLPNFENQFEIFINKLSMNNIKKLDDLIILELKDKKKKELTLFAKEKNINNLFDINFNLEVIYTEIKKLSKNYSIHFNNDLYNFNLITKINEKDFTINIDLDKLYPFVSPKIYLVKPIVDKNPLKFTRTECFTDTKWNFTVSLQTIVNQFEFFLDSCNILSEEKYTYELLMLLNLENDYITDKIKLYETKQDSKTKKSLYWKNGLGYGHGSTKSKLSKWLVDYKEKNKLQNIIRKNFLNKKSINDEEYISLELNKYIENLINKISMTEYVNNDIFYNFLFDKYKNNLKNINLKKFKNEYELYKKLENKSFPILESLFVNIENNSKIGNKCEYTKLLTPYKFCMLNFKNENISYTKFNDKSTANNKSTKTVITQIQNLNSSIPLHINSSIFCIINENNFYQLKILITGPKDTPYDCGCFIFDMYLPKCFPNEPPKMKIMTTGYGTVRFNPNLYKNGKVCLSILNTWAGSADEKWQPDISTIEAVLVSVQSFIFVENPYFNEPGYEANLGTNKGDMLNKKYNDDIRFYTLKYAINENLKKLPNGFQQIITTHCSLKKDYIIEKYSQFMKETIKISKADWQKEIDLFKTLV